MKFTTSITEIKDDKEIIRGNKLEELITQKNFTEVIILVLQGKLPNEKELKMWNAIFVSAIDHGPGTPSALTARISASAKNSMHTALAAGLLGMGEKHGLVTESAMNFFIEHSEEKDIPGLLTRMKEQKVYVPGFGHKVLTRDSRVDALFIVAKECGVYGKYCMFAETLHEELNNISSKPLPMNIDGGMGAILCDMGIDPRLSRGIFMIARVPGLIAHIYEEMTGDAGIRRLSEDDVEYVS